MIVVSDTSPILNLARIGHAELLCALYGEILIPRAVDEELRRNNVGGGVPPCLIVRDPSDEQLVRELRASLDPGESAAIALALEYRADLLIADERKGRNRAQQLGLDVIGLLGILIEAKRRGLVPHCRPLVEALQRDARFWISRPLRERFLQLAGEGD